MSIQKQLIFMYLDRFNNYLTDRKFAEDYNLSTKDAKTLLQMGKEFHEENVQFYAEHGLELYK